MKIIEKRVQDLKEIKELKEFYENQPIEELMYSIKSYGQLTPIHIREDEGIVNGYRVVEACKALGKETVTAIVLSGCPGIQERIALNKYRNKTANDNLKEIREIFKMFPKKQGQRAVDDTPYDRAERLSSALNNRWKGDVILNKVEYILENDLEGNVLGKGMITNNWKVDPCYDYLTKFRDIDLENGYGFTSGLKNGIYTVSEVNKFISQRHALDKKYDHTFVIPEKSNSYRMNCVDLARLPEYSRKVSLLFTSIPYWKLKDYQEGESRQLGHEKTKEEYGMNVAAILREDVKTLDETANVIINIGETYIDGLAQGIPYLIKEFIERETSLVYKGTLIWSKKNPHPIGENVKRPVDSTEFLLWFVVNPKKSKYKLLTFPVEGKKAKVTNGARDVSYKGVVSKKRKSVSKTYGKIKSHLKEQEIENIIVTSVGKNHDIFKISEVGHPAPMSPMLPVTMILMLTDEGDLVFDPFGGTNVVGKVALELNRQYLSTDISKQFFEIGCEMVLKGSENFDRESLDEINEMVYPGLEKGQDGKYEQAA
jgi:site-specific DNA-methyltransferase (cytosine-N4-specific)